MVEKVRSPAFIEKTEPAEKFRGSCGGGGGQSGAGALCQSCSKLRCNTDSIVCWVTRDTSKTLGGFYLI